MNILTKLFLFILSIIILGFVIPQNFSVPVDAASKNDYNQKSYWHYPWGKSITHKGVDIFAKEGTDVVSATGGLVIGAGQIGMGGNFVLVLGPKWRFHYYAHLERIHTSKYKFVRSGEVIAKVGTSGNAKGKPPHLHYSIVSAIPYPWRLDKSPQGHRKMFYLNPIKYLNQQF